MNIFRFDSYKTYLRVYIDAKKQKGMISKLAREAGCDRTYLSQTLNGKAQLTTDHAIRLAAELGLDETEQDYFLLLVLYDRASNREAKSKLKQRLQKMVAQNLLFTKKIQDKEVVSEPGEAQKTQYYSSWLYTMVHLLTSIPSFQTRRQLQQHLHLGDKYLDSILDTLVKAGLVKQNGDRFIHSGQNIFLSSDSPLLPMHHLNWRLKAVENSAAKKGLHYCLTFSVSKCDVEELKTQLLDFVANQRNFIHKSGCEEVLCFCCDLFAPNE